MTKGQGYSGRRTGASGSFGGGATGSPRMGGSGTSSARSTANSKMWKEPATAKQIAALKANGNFDGKYYSKGRAGQNIGESVRARDAARVRPAAMPQARLLPLASDAVRSGDVVSHVPSQQPLSILSAPAEPASTALVVPDNAPRVPGSGVLSFSFLSDLESRHLRSFQSEHSSNWGDQLRAETKAWVDMRVKVARMLSAFHEELTGILTEAPAGAVPDPVAAARDFLATGALGSLEERHLRAFMSEHSSNWGDELRREICKWVRSRIDIARSEARALVELAKLQAEQTGSANTKVAPALAGALTTESAPRSAHWTGHVPATRLVGTVDRINAHGAQIVLESGDRGWLHISKLRTLNNGVRVDDISTFLHVGQRIGVRSVGTNARGQVVLVLARGKRTTSARTVDEPPSVVEPPLKTPVPAEAKRSLLSRLLTPRPGT